MSLLKIFGLPIVLWSLVTSGAWVFKGDKSAGQNYVARYNQACSELLIIRFDKDLPLPTDNWQIVYLNNTDKIQAEIRSLATDSVQVADPLKDPYTAIYRSTGGKLRIRKQSNTLNIQLENATFKNGDQTQKLDYAEILW